MEAQTAISIASAAWVSVALLAAGFAGMRGRGKWVWFLSSLIFGPIAIFLLVVWPPVDAPQPPR